MPKQPDAMILLTRLEREARAGTPAAASFFHDTVRAVIGKGGRVWFTVNNGPRLHQRRAIEALDYIEASEQRRAALIAAAAPKAKAQRPPPTVRLELDLTVNREAIAFFLEAVERAPSCALSEDVAVDVFAITAQLTDIIDRCTI
jgi:hypothetical protein